MDIYQFRFKLENYDGVGADMLTGRRSCTAASSAEVQLQSAAARQLQARPSRARAF
jgi:hypothetical protein